MGLHKRCLLAFAVLLGGGLLCTAMRAQQSPKPLTNADVVKMIKGGVPQSVVVGSIKSNPSNFDLSPDALVRLHRLGVPEKVLDAMMAAAAQQPPATAPAAQTPVEAPVAAPAPAEVPAASAPSAPEAPAPASAPAAAPPAAPAPASAPAAPTGLPAVTFLQGDTPQPLAIEKTQLEATQAKPSSMLSLASDSALTPVVQGEANQAIGNLASHVHSQFGGASVMQTGGLLSGIMARRKPDQTYVWAVPNPASSNVLPTRSPTFSVDFSGVPGVNAADYTPAIVKLTPSQNAWRLVGATVGKGDATSSSTLDWQIYSKFLEDRVALRSNKTALGQYQISPATPLLPGEYAVVLRPITRDKKFSGADVARGEGDGLMFDSAWSFQVAPDARP